MTVLKQLLGVAAGTMLVLGLAVPGTSAVGQTPVAVPKFDLNRYMGTWYEAARLPNKMEKHCVSDAMVLYALGDKPNQFQVVNSCQVKNGSTDARNASGREVNKTGDGRLKVSYLWPFSSKYWVLAVGPEYEWALVGSPNHKSLWLLSRMSEIKPEVLDEMKAKAAAEGFSLAKLVTVAQHH